MHRISGGIPTEIIGCSGEIEFFVYNEQTYKVYLFCYVH